MKEIILRQISLYDEIKKLVPKDTSSEDIRSIYYECNKDLRTNMIQEQNKYKKTEKMSGSLPSFKQIEYAKSLKIPSPETYSKKELSRKIEEVKNHG